MLIFVPLGIAAHMMELENHTIIFALNALAIVPLTGFLTCATENIAHSLGVGLGALLNITFGNLVEIVIMYVTQGSP
jgi:Ca2+:H+ antiporter